jgi:hypothetical protein
VIAKTEGELVCRNDDIISCLLFMDCAFQTTILVCAGLTICYVYKLGGALEEEVERVRGIEEMEDDETEGDENEDDVDGEGGDSNDVFSTCPRLLYVIRAAATPAVVRFDTAEERAVDVEEATVKLDDDIIGVEEYDVEGGSDGVNEVGGSAPVCAEVDEDCGKLTSVFVRIWFIVFNACINMFIC